MKQKLFLSELTGQDSGAVVYNNGNTIICNWSGFYGLPYLFGPFGLFGVEHEGISVESTTTTDNAIEYLEEVIYDRNGDAPNLENYYAKVWIMSDGTIILAPENWA